MSLLDTKELAVLTYHALVSANRDELGLLKNVQHTEARVAGRNAMKTAISMAQGAAAELEKMK